MTTTNVKALNNRLIEILTSRSVKMGNFTLSSGRQSSFYIDARLTTMSAEGLEVVGPLGLNAIRVLGWKAAAVGGLTLGADPIACAIALASRRAPPSIDAFTVRKDPKAHGTGQQIEGCFQRGMSVVIVEDSMTTGASALRAVEVVRKAGGTISGVLCIVDREEGGADAVRAAGYPVEALLSLKSLGL